MQQLQGTSRIALGPHPKRFTCRLHGSTWPTARAGGLHTIHNAYQALMTSTCELRAACCTCRVEVAECSSSQARRESASDRTLSA